MTLLAQGLPDDVLRQLKNRGVELARVAALVDSEAGDAVLLAGSYATGEANPTSDLDLLVLTAHERAPRALGMTNHPSLLGDSFDGQAGDLVVNVEYVPRQRLANIGKIAASVTSAEVPSLPNLQGLELRLVHRVTTGVFLTGKDQADGYREQLRPWVIQASAAALAFLGALSLIEDTTVLASPERELMRRGAAESLLLAGVNAFGPLTYDGKHLLARAAVLARQPGSPKLFTERHRLLFADRLSQEDGLRLVLDLAEDLYRCFADPLLLRMLAPYASGWEWTGRQFWPTGA
jgi:predicted nucleotidyltransferase